MLNLATCASSCVKVLDAHDGQTCIHCNILLRSKLAARGQQWPIQIHDAWYCYLPAAQRVKCYISIRSSSRVACLVSTIIAGGSQSCWRNMAWPTKRARASIRTAIARLIRTMWRRLRVRQSRRHLGYWIPGNVVLSAVWPRKSSNAVSTAEPRHDQTGKYGSSRNCTRQTQSLE